MDKRQQTQITRNMTEEEIEKERQREEEEIKNEIYWRVYV